MEIKILCQKRYCENFKIIDWNGEFIEKWYCDRHKDYEKMEKNTEKGEKNGKNKIYQGDALEVLKTFPNESINTLMTSPPYWALRDYGIEGQLGLEPTFDLYIKHLCDIFDEVKRVLRKDGTCWVNIGDTYSTISGSGFEGDLISKDNSGKGIKRVMK